MRILRDAPWAFSVVVLIDQDALAAVLNRVECPAQICHEGLNLEKMHMLVLLVHISFLIQPPLDEFLESIVHFCKDLDPF